MEFNRIQLSPLLTVNISLLILFYLLCMTMFSNSAFTKDSTDKINKKSNNPLIDKSATKETIQLFINLKKISKDHTLFGHQHATEYGHGWHGEEDRSDVKSVTGSHPAMIGVDLMGLTGNDTKRNQTNALKLKTNVINTYNRGGITTIAWHFKNPISNDGFSWNNATSKPAVKFIIPGGSEHHKYKKILTSIGKWAKSLVGADGKLVPVIFRPYHEFDGNWFWWGKSHCTKAEFIKLWRFTVSYLRDELSVHNFIYAFSPDNKFNNETQFLERYPGDAYVDMVGMDNYADLGRNGYNISRAIKKLKIVSDYAIKHHKLAAFTETGLESIPNKKWWTDVLLKIIKSKKLELCYVLVWRNDAKSATHYYAPFPGQTSAANFKLFYKDKHTLFEKDLINIYKK